MMWCLGILVLVATTIILKSYANVSHSSLTVRGNNEISHSHDRLIYPCGEINTMTDAEVQRYSDYIVALIQSRVFQNLNVVALLTTSSQQNFFLLVISISSVLCLRGWKELSLLVVRV